MPLQIKLSYQYWKSNLKTLFSSASYVVVRMAMLFCRSGGRSTFGSWLKYLTHWTDARGLTSMTASCILQHHHEVERCSLNNCWIGYISRQSRPWKASVILSVLPTFVTFMPKKQCVSPAAEQGSSHSWVAVIMWSNSEQNISTHRIFFQCILSEHNITLATCIENNQLHVFSTSLHVLPVHTWVLSGYSGLSPTIQRLIGYP